MNNLTESRVYADFTPAVLDIMNYDELKKEVERYSAKYDGLVFDASDKKEAEQARSALLSLNNAIEEERKRIKRVYNQPLNEFEAKIKELTSILGVPLDSIREGIKEINEKEKVARQDALNDVLSERVKDLNIHTSDIEQDDRWLNKGNWTDTFKPTQKLSDEIDFAIKNAVAVAERKETEVRLLTEFCKSKDIQASGWVNMLDHRSATEVMDLINRDIELKQEREQKQLEESRKLEEFQAKQAEEVKVAKEDVQAIQTKDEEVVTNIIKVSATPSKLALMNDFLIEHGIQVEEYVILEAEDDLPW